MCYLIFIYFETGNITHSEDSFLAFKFRQSLKKINSEYTQEHTACVTCTTQLTAMFQVGFHVSRFTFTSLRVATGQEVVREKYKGQGKVREFYFEPGIINISKKIQGKLKFYHC